MTKDIKAIDKLTKVILVLAAINLSSEVYFSK